MKFSASLKLKAVRLWLVLQACGVVAVCVGVFHLAGVGVGLIVTAVLAAVVAEMRT